MSKDHKTAEYFEEMKDMKLSESSRVRIQEELLAHARFHPVRVEGDSRSTKQVPQRTSLFNLLRNKTMTVAMIAIVLVAGGGTSYAAESAVPGDALYVVKTEVNENVKSAFAVSNEAEARLQARLAEERLEEAEELAARGELSAEASANIRARLKEHYEEAQKRSDGSESDGDYQSPATVRASLEGSFRSYADVLTDLNASVPGNNGASLITDIRTYADAAAEAQATATVDVSADVRVDVEATINRAENRITEVTTKLERAESEVSASAHARAAAKLDEAVEAQAEAKASFQAEAYQAAYTSVQTAIRLAKEVETMIGSALRIQIEAASDTTIEAGVLDAGVDVNSNTQTETNTKAEIGSEAEAENSTRTEATEEQGDDSSLDVEVNATSGTEVDTNSTDAEVETDTSVRGGMSL